MTDAAIVALTESPLPLTWLNFSYCLDITDVGVAAVAAKCINLVVRIVLPTARAMPLSSRLADVDSTAAMCLTPTCVSADVANGRTLQNLRGFCLPVYPLHPEAEVLGHYAMRQTCVVSRYSPALSFCDQFCTRSDP